MPRGTFRSDLAVRPLFALAALWFAFLAAALVWVGRGLGAPARTVTRVGAAGLALAASSAQAQTPDTLSEASAVARALAASPALRSAEAAVALARAERDADGAFLTGGPELDVDAALNPIEPPTPGDVEAGVSVSQTLERPAVRRARRAAADSRLAVAEGQRRAARYDLVTAVRAAVADLAAAQDAARLAREALVAADTLVSVARLRYRFGDVSELDWRLAQADAAAVAAEVSRTEAERTAAASALTRLLATPGLRVAVPPLDALPPVPVDTLAPAFRPDVEVAGLVARAAGFEADLGRERARFPTFTVRAGLERRALFYGPDDVDGADVGDDFSLGRRETEVTLGLSVPLPFGGAGRREARRAEATAQLRAAESAEIQAGAMSDVSASVDAVRESSRSLSRLDGVTSDLAEVDALLDLASSGGEIDVPTLLAQRDRVRGVRRAFLDARATDRRARLALARALGRPAAGLPVDPE